MQLRQLIYGKPLDTDTWLIAYDSEGAGPWNNEPERLRAVLAYLLPSDWEVQGHTSLFRVLVKSTKEYWTYYKVFPNGTDRDPANRCIFRFHAVRMSEEELGQLKWNPWGLDDLMVSSYGGYKIVGPLLPGGKLDIGKRTVPLNKLPLVVSCDSIISREKESLDEHVLADLIAHWRVGAVRLTTTADNDSEKFSYASSLLRETAGEASVGAFISVDVPSVLDSTPSHPSRFALGVKAQESRASRIDEWPIVDLKTRHTASGNISVSTKTLTDSPDTNEALQAWGLLRAKLESIELKVDAVLAKPTPPPLGPIARLPQSAYEMPEAEGRVTQVLCEIDLKLEELLRETRIVRPVSPASKADETRSADITDIRSGLDALRSRIDNLPVVTSITSTPASPVYSVWWAISTVLLSIACLALTFLVLYDLKGLEAGAVPSGLEHKLSEITRQAVADQFRSEPKGSSDQNGLTGEEQDGKKAPDANSAPGGEINLKGGQKKKNGDKNKTALKKGQGND